MDWNTWMSLPSCRATKETARRTSMSFLFQTPKWWTQSRFPQVVAPEQKWKKKKKTSRTRAMRARGMGAWAVVFPTSLCDPWLLLVRMEKQSKQFQATWELAPHSLRQAGPRDRQCPLHRGSSVMFAKHLGNNWLEYLWVSRLWKIKDRIYLPQPEKEKKKKRVSRKGVGPPCVVKPVGCTWMVQGRNRQPSKSQHNLEGSWSLTDIWGSDPALHMFQLRTNHRSPAGDVEDC